VKREKQLLLDEMEEQIKQSGPFIVTNYEKLSAPMVYNFRREVEAVGGYYEVVRKRMFMLAVKRLGIEFDSAALPGHVGLVLGAKDPIEAAKLVQKFNKKEGEFFTFLGGYVEGQKTSKEDVQKLATLPSKEQLQSQILALMEAPMSNLVGIMDSLLASVVRCVEGKIQSES